MHPLFPTFQESKVQLHEASPSRAECTAHCVGAQQCSDVAHPTPTPALTASPRSSSLITSLSLGVTGSGDFPSLSRLHPFQIGAPPKSRAEPLCCPRDPPDAGPHQSFRGCPGLCPAPCSPANVSRAAHCTFSAPYVTLASTKSDGPPRHSLSHGTRSRGLGKHLLPLGVTVP